MYLPEYSITNKTLRNISNIGYNQALIENTPILPNWERQLKKEARIRALCGSLKFMGANASYEDVKRYVDSVATVPSFVKNVSESLDFVESKTNVSELEEKDLKDLQRLVSGNSAGTGSYRKRNIAGTVHPEEILAEIVELMDWYNSLDARDTHPIITAGILKIKLEAISPFEQTNFLVSNLLARLALKIAGYEVKNYYCLEEWYGKSKWEYDSLVKNCGAGEELTKWLEYFTEGLSMELSNIKEKVTLLARDTKVAKVSGRIKLTDRQEKIIEHLQDYGLLQNKDFAKVFPDVSEDSILRDLKALMSKKIVVKSGSTKSSRYELS